MDADLYRASLARVPLPVAVVTARGADGVPVGFTASSVCSLSVSPPSLLVCVDQATRSYGIMRECEEFTVDFLATEHRNLARLFATRGADKFSSPYVVTDEGGRPRIANAIVHLQCRAGHRFDGYDHLVVIGDVTEVAVSEGDPLLIADRAFTAPALHRWPFAGSASPTAQ